MDQELPKQSIAPDEPSVLDYVKARLMPWRASTLRGQLTRHEGPEATAGPPLERVVPSADTAPEPDGRAWSRPTPGSLVAEARERTVARAGAVAWRSISALLLALIGQRAFEPPDRSVGLGLLFYSMALAMLAVAIWRGEWKLPELREATPAAEAPRARYPALLVASLLAVMAYLTMGQNLFTGLNVLLWLGALAYFVQGFRAAGIDLSAIGERVQAWVRQPTWRMTIRPMTVLVLAAFLLAAFFRLSRLADVPGEMFSDHAEKLMDVADVLDGHTQIFFPRNTGREAFQMYLTATAALVFGTGLSFLSLKLGTALAGLFTLPFLYFLGREIGGRRVGLFALLFAGVAYWPNVISRVALRFTLYPFLAAPTLYFLIRGLRRRSRNDFILSGVFLGLGFHGYSPFRVMPLVVLVAVGLYLVHRQSSGGRAETIRSTAVLSWISFIVFLPLLRYAIDNPEMFSYRTLTRMGDLERPLPGSPVAIFLDNLRDALAMFFWDNGNIWVHSVTSRPALDYISAALFAIGLGLVLLRYLRRRNWLDLFLLVSIPLLLLPSILSLAFPEENPSLNRTGGALIPVFLLVGIALDSLTASIEVRAQGRWGRGLGWVLAGLLMLGSASLNYDLVFRQYARQFELGAWNTTELGGYIRAYADSVGTPDTAWVVPYPHWVDTRLVGINAGYPRKDYALWPDQLPETRAIPGPKLFLIKPEDQDTVSLLRELYPEGALDTVHSRLPGKDFLAYLVPRNPGAP